MVTSVKAEPRTTTGGCGIYDLGHSDSYLRAFITDRGRMVAINHRAITAEDLIEVYMWGRAEQREDDADFIKSNGAPFVEAEVISQNAPPPFATPITDEDIPL